MTSATNSLLRLFKPQTIAVVGASENGLRSRNAIEAMTGFGHQLHLVNRRGEQVMGLQTHRSLDALARDGIVPDAAMVFTNAAAAVDVVGEAARLGVGGVVVNAGGFAEAGVAGAMLQQRLVAAAGSMPVIGPNSNGIVSPALGLHLAGSPPGLPIRKGKLAFVTHSGATMMPMAIAGVERMVGFSYLVSTGNEAMVDMAEVLAFLATDPGTSAICLLIETIRNPAGFWAAVETAISAGKPVLALKNGRSARGQAIAKSHTGAVAGEAWVYAAALKQHGVIVADDLVDLIDRAVLFDQVPRSKWKRATGLVVVSGSGGYVTMASDVCAEEGIDLPELAELGPAIRETVAEASVVNPLDLTGAAMADAAVMAGALKTFDATDKVDTILIQTALAQEAAPTIRNFAGPALELAPRSDKLLIIGSIEGGAIGAMMQNYLDSGIAVTRGLRATIRAIRSMGDFVDFTARPAGAFVPAAVLHVPRDIIAHQKAGRMVSFAATMELLTRAGVPVAPYAVIGAEQVFDDAMPFAPPYAVKLADVPHRSDIGAVRLNVTPETLRETVEELRALADRLGEAPTVAVQKQYRISSELLVGVNAESELGPMVVCGPGGIFVEVLRQVSGRLAPFGHDEAKRLIREVGRDGILDGLRGTMSWPQEALAELVENVGRFAVGARDWLESLDINPLALTPDGIFAVDGLMIVRDPPCL